MARDNKIQMPGVFGGLMRYDSEYKSKFMMSPKVVVAYIIAIIVFVVLLKIFVAVPEQLVTNVQTGHGGAFWSLLKDSFG